MNVVWQERNWIIEDIRDIYKVGPYLVSHKCSEYQTYNWRPFAFRPEAVGRCCIDCGERPPDGVQSTFWFLMSDEVK